MNKIKVASSLCCLLAAFAFAQPLQAKQETQLPASVVARPDVIVPLNNWVYPAFDKIEEIQGIAGCSLFRRKKSQSLTRYEFALFTLRLRRQKIWRDVERLPQGGLLDEADVKDIIAMFEREFELEIAQILSPPPESQTRKRPTMS